MAETKRDRIVVRVFGLLVTLASIAAIAVVYLARHGKGPLRHLDLSGDVTNYYFGAGTFALLGLVFAFAKIKNKESTVEQPAQESQQQVQAPPQGQQPPSQYPQQWAQPQPPQGQYPQYPPQQPPSQYPPQPPYDPNRPS